VQRRLAESQVQIDTFKYAHSPSSPFFSNYLFTFPFLRLLPSFFIFYFIFCRATAKVLLAELDTIEQATTKVQESVQEIPQLKA
jgi:hypothetical protein